MTIFDKPVQNESKEGIVKDTIVVIEDGPIGAMYEIKLKKAGFETVLLKDKYEAEDWLNENQEYLENVSMFLCDYEAGNGDLFDEAIRIINNTLGSDARTIANSNGHNDALTKLGCKFDHDKQDVNSIVVLAELMRSDRKSFEDKFK